MILLFEAYPFFFIAIGLRTKLDESRWAVAMAACVLQMLHTIADLSALGQRFTHISFYNDVIDTPLFTIQGVGFGLEKVTSLALFAAIIYAVYSDSLSNRRDAPCLSKNCKVPVKFSKFIIPEILPSLDRFAISSAYTPAQCYL